MKVEKVCQLMIHTLLYGRKTRNLIKTEKTSHFLEGLLVTRILSIKREPNTIKDKNKTYTGEIKTQYKKVTDILEKRVKKARDSIPKYSLRRHLKC